MKRIRVAMIAPPWLAIPPHGYGGIENVINALVPALMAQNVDVELFATGDTTLTANKNHWTYKTGQYGIIHKPYYDALPILGAHILSAINYIKKDGQFDVIHDHNSYIGPMILASSFDSSLPPILHTLHGPPFTKNEKSNGNQPLWAQIPKNPRFFVVGISEAHMQNVPVNLKRQSLPVVYNGVATSNYRFVEKKDDYFITLARFHPDKGESTAIRACQKFGYRLKMAGIVGDMSLPKQIMMELVNPLSTYRALTDFRYFSDEIFPHLEEKQIEYVGGLQGQQKIKFVSHARALLFPIRWEEPFGMAIIEALACGTPVIAMARGAVPEIIKHGVNGFLARTEKEFQSYLPRIGEIDPKACLESVKDKFSAETMASSYINRYQTIISRTSK